MTATETWVRRMMHLNVLQLIVNAGLAFVLLLWFIGLPGGDGTQPQEQWGQPMDQATFVDDAPAQAGLAPEPGGAEAEQPSGPVDPAEALWEAGAGETGEGQATRPAPGSGGRQGAPGLPPTAVAQYLTQTIAALNSAAAEQDEDVSDYLPSEAEMMAAAGTGDFFNPKTLAVLRKLRKGFEALGATMPKIPEEGPG